MDKLTLVQEYYLYQFEAPMQLYADVLHMELAIMRDLLRLSKRFNTAFAIWSLEYCNN